MRTLVLLSTIFVLSSANASDTKKDQATSTQTIKRSCKTDVDCVLYMGICSSLLAVSFESLPQEAQLFSWSESKNKQLFSYFATPSTVDICMNIQRTDFSFPAIAKCKERKCEVVFVPERTKQKDK